jgi:hypothetical protein
MSVSLYDLSIGSYTQIVEAMLGVMKKGAEHCEAEGIDLAEVVATRLYPDMANFHFQVTSLTHHSLGAIEGLKSGSFGPPAYPDCGYPELQAMTEQTLAELRAQKPDEIEALAGGQVVFRLGDNEIPFTSENFVLSFSMPNFYFHATTAYDILRSKGVPLGKRDFLGAIRVGA